MKDWERIAHSFGYETERLMWAEMYKTHSISELSQKLGVSMHTVRIKLADAGVPIRSRGGPNYVKADLSDITDEDIALRGIPAIAIEKGVSPSTVYKRLIYRKGKHLRPQPEEEQGETEQPDSPEPETPPSSQ